MLLNSEKSSSIPVITIDGPSGSGKGTISYLLAQDLAWHFLDSGAIYRIAAWVATETQTPFEEDRLLPIMSDLEQNISVQTIAKRFRIFWQQQDITESIRTEEIGQWASKLGTYPKVRQSLLVYQRSFRRPPGLVADGRDMGSVVFPDAKLKIFLDASLEERAKRRYLQLKAKGKHVSLSAVRAELEQRDCQDRQRPVAPLVVPTGAIIIDSTHLSIQQVLQLIKSKLFPA
ncbi:MAG: (d)CMP kinase [Gammaproteobacteria bacterium]|nr:MAG: (d)CMP kinase [Gammaproteobacteria bacterium]